MATITTSTMLGGTGGSNLLPRNISSQIWAKAQARSIIPGLAASTPIIIGDNVFPQATKTPSATIVGEGGNKKDSTLELGAKVIKPIKAQVGLEFTLEEITQNPSGVLGLLQAQLGDALARQVDLAIMHKIVADTGATITVGGDVPLSSAPFVKLAVSNGVDNGIDDEIEVGYQLVTAAGYDFSAFAMDPKGLALLRSAKNSTNNTRFHPELGFSAAVTSFAGSPAAVSKTVSGQVDAGGDTGLRILAGDFNMLKFGYALNIPVKKIEYGDPFGNGDLQRRNAVGYLAEVIFGWAVLDPNAFVAFRDIQAWAATTAYPLGRHVTVTGGTLAVTTAGTSGATAPTNPGAVGGTVTDGTVVWTRVA